MMSSCCIKRLSEVFTQTYLYHIKRTPLTLFTRTISSNNSDQSEIISNTSLNDKKNLNKYKSDVDGLLSQSNYSKKQFDNKSQYFKKIYATKQKESESAMLLEDNAGSAFSPTVRSVKDLRDPNERIDELIPEDVEKKIDGRLKIILSRNGRIGKSAYFYDKKISSLGRQGRTKEALAIFEEDMMVRDRVMPRKKTFVILLGQLAHKGHTTKCFQLFRKMKQLGLDPEDKCYTSLFNACANSFDKSYGLSRAYSLLNYMNENGVQSNLFTLKASMKAFAVCGDLPTAFALLDDASHRMQLDAECFNHLLMACISDKSAGFNRAIQVWLQMKKFGIKPEKNTINLLIRCARDCGVGRQQDLLAALGISTTDNIALNGTDCDILPGNKGGHRSVTSDSEELPLSCQSLHTDRSLKPDNFSLPCDLNSSKNITGTYQADKNSSELSRDSMLNKDVKNNSEVYEWWEEDKITVKLNSNLLHFPITAIDESNSKVLTKKSNVENPALVIRNLDDLKKPEGRLALLGGPLRLLEMMDALHATPDVKTYSQLLSCLPNTSTWELWLLTQMEKRQHKPDVDFLNDIMIRRTKRDKESVKAVVPFMLRLHLTPNMRTYAALALTCHTEEAAMKLIEDMKNANLEPTAVVMGHLINASGFKFSYKRRMLEVMEEMGHKPVRDCITNIEKTIKTVKQRILEAEKSDPDNQILTEGFRISFGNFMNYYRLWLQRTEIIQPKHPWDEFDAAGKMIRK